MSRRRKGVSVRSAFDQVARGVRVLLYVTVGVLLLLALSEVPIVEAWLGGLGSQASLVGLVAGHWQSDSGAVCPDGLQEVEINLAVARRVAQILKEQGYRVEVLPEFSPKLDGYRAALFLSIHADSCIDTVSGFKVARLSNSSVPDLEDRLVTCLYDAYSTATGLEPHYDSITDDMRQYHALRQIAPETPGAIIECGFMGSDRYLLTQEQDRVAVGIANGLLAFLRDTAPIDNARGP